MSESQLDLDEHEINMLKSVVRMEIRHTLRKRRRLIEKFGDEAEVDRSEITEDTLRDIYEKLGGDPDNITNVGAS